MDMFIKFAILAVIATGAFMILQVAKIPETFKQILYIVLTVLIVVYLIGLAGHLLPSFY